MNRFLFTCLLPVFHSHRLNLNFFLTIFLKIQIGLKCLRGKGGLFMIRRSTMGGVHLKSLSREGILTNCFQSLTRQWEAVCSQRLHQGGLSSSRSQRLPPCPPRQPVHTEVKQCSVNFLDKIDNDYGGFTQFICLTDAKRILEKVQWTSYNEIKGSELRFCYRQGSI